MVYYKAIKNNNFREKGGKECLSFFMDNSKMRAYLLFLGIMAIVTFTVEASLNLTVTPYEGMSLRFGEVNSDSYINKEVKIRITSTDGVQYRLRQRLLEPVVSDKGEILNEGVLNFYTVRGTNASGSLYQDTLRVLSTRDEILYTSNRTGDSDSFVIVYSVDGKKISQSGHFRGKILYTLESVGGASSKTYILDLSLNANPAINVTIEAPSGRVVKLGTRYDSDLKSSLKVKLNIPPESNIKIYQDLTEPLTKEDGTVLEEGAIKFFVSGLSKGESNYKSASSLMRGRALIYSSDEGSSEFYINLFIDKELIKGASAGLYKGELIYYFEGENINETIPIKLEVETARVFDIKVTSEEGFSFLGVKPGNPPQEKVVKVEVNTNMKAPYQVIQRVTMPLTDEKGNKIPEKFFRMKVELPGKDKGKTDFLDFHPVGVGDKIIFTSTAEGDPVSFDIIYRLDVSYEVIAGNYSTQVTYLLSEK